MTHVLIIDNYDSFTYNLKQYFAMLGCKVTVIKNDAMTAQQSLALSPSHMVLSPGPGNPDDSGITMNLLECYHDRLPILGVCLGHQCIAAAFGGKVVHASQVMHAKNSWIQHQGEGIFAGLPQRFSVTRYHSLVVDTASLPACLAVTAWSDDDKQPPAIMGLQHRSLPIYGVQFHPEALLSEHGHDIVRNFLTST